MIKFIIFLLPFIKEMIFGRRQENRNSFSFLTKLKQWTFFTIVVTSLGLNYIAIKRLYSLSVVQIQLSKENAKMLELAENYKAELIKNSQLESNLKYCIISVKR